MLLVEGPAVAVALSVVVAGAPVEPGRKSVLCLAAVALSQMHEDSAIDVSLIESISRMVNSKLFSELARPGASRRMCHVRNRVSIAVHCGLGLNANNISLCSICLVLVSELRNHKCGSHVSRCRDWQLFNLLKPLPVEAIASCSPFPPPFLHPLPDPAYRPILPP